MEIKEIVEQLNKSNAYIERKKYAEADKILDKLLKKIEYYLRIKALKRQLVYLKKL